MRAVADSTPLIYLSAISQFDLLRLYFSSVLIPNAVHEEVVRAGDEQHGPFYKELLRRAL